MAPAADIEKPQLSPEKGSFPVLSDSGAKTRQPWDVATADFRHTGNAVSGSVG